MAIKLRTIVAHEVFKQTKASTLFELYTNAVKHQLVTGAPAVITDRLGEPFNLYDGFCFGENIELKKNRLIIQAWRTEDWPSEADDSIVVLRFVEDGTDTHLYLTHADLPEPLADALKDGWKTFYWTKWRAYLKEF